MAKRGRKPRKFTRAQLEALPPWRKRLFEYERKCGSFLEAGNRLGVSEGALRKWVYEGATPGLKNLASIEAEVGVTPNEVLGIAPPPDPDTQDLPDAHLVPTLAYCSCDPDTTLEWEEGDYLDPVNLTGLKAYQAKGNSMEPLAREGQWILTDPEAVIRSGDLVLAWGAPRGPLFKKWYERPGVLVSVNQNDDYEPIPVGKSPPQMEKVIGVIFTPSTQHPRQARQKTGTYRAEEGKADYSGRK